jgi:glycosyltransferase involved in cell wall biosynthesis
MTDLRPYSREWYAALRGLLGDHACRQLGVYALPDDFVLSVVVPVYNEEATLREIVARVAAVPVPKEIILVDDCSRDKSWSIMQELAAESAATDCRIVLKQHDINRGKGHALRTGFAAATGAVVVVQDADLEYDPAEYAELLTPLIDGRADVVYGSRFITGRPHRVLYYWHSLGNRVLTTVSNMFTDLNLTDMETCYKAFRREVIQQLDLEEDRFGIEPEITAKVANGRWRVYEVGVSYSGRTYEEGKKIGWRDGLRALYCIVRYSPIAQRLRRGRSGPT